MGVIADGLRKVYRSQKGVVAGQGARIQQVYSRRGFEYIVAVVGHHSHITGDVGSDILDESRD